MTFVEKRDHNWIPVEGELREQILIVLRKIIIKYKDPEKLISLITTLENSNVTEVEYKTGVSLGSGLTGICLLLGQLDQLFPTEDWDVIGHEYLVLLNKHMQENGINDLSLYNGLAGILVGVRALSRNGTRYTQMLDTLASLYEDMFAESVGSLKERWNSGDIQMGDYDTISGLAGIARVVLMFLDRPKMREIWSDIEELLHFFCGEKDIADLAIPRWHITASNQFQKHETLQYPNGNFNLGLSHGISGPLSLMSISVLQGLGSDSVLKDICRLSEWLSIWTIQNDVGTYWPGRVSFEEAQSGKLTMENQKFNRDSWCYGVPGIARALWLAGTATNDEKWTELALNSFLEIDKRITNLGGLASATLCHGIAGLLQSVQRLYSETKDKRLESIRDKLIISILNMFEPESIFGFYEINIINDKLEKINDSGFLNGNAGVALVLASLISDESPEWDSVLMYC
ncbi:lanthionine synthetase C family protein [Paenibacillus sp. FSL P4-0338]|uniref:lanthionine synthetase C family protein n=1 Tax=unclassified Paenibacillus TaxID=185978 RepID=UPI0003E1BF30|nr:lanthionine synthetase C family protein [Paenibacillus sp. FSL R7-269]ETT44678.1 hypothetical protein C162_22205 [Paenibacillus sp. FSL R7-269]